ncbi:hypothetical protein ACWGA9_28710 [Streptomyces sp. NPDC054950]
MSDARVPFVGDFRELEQGSPDGPSLRSAVKAKASANARELVEYLQIDGAYASAADDGRWVELTPTRDLLMGVAR